MIPENFVGRLSSELDPVLVKDLLDEYRAIRRNHSIGDYEKALIQAGKFCETVFQILEYMTSGVASKEPEISGIAKALERLPKDKFQDSIRIIMPLAARAIYSIRSKRGAAHKRQEISPCYMDSAFVLSTCNWILSEFVRLYYTGDEAEIVAIIHSLGEQEIPIIENVDDRPVVSRLGIIGRLMKIDSEEFAPIYNLTGRDRYLFMLKIAKSKGIDGLTPVEIESVLKERLMMKGIHVSNIRRDLRNSGRFVERFPFGKGYAYAITNAGEDHLKNVLSKSE